MTEQEQTMCFCPQCGARVQPGSRFCGQCGAAFDGGHGSDSNGRDSQTDGQESFGRRAANAFDKGLKGLMYFLEQPDYIIDEPTEDLFVEKNVPYYRQKFYEMRTLHQKVSFNGAALVFGVLWMLYRKMYGVAAAAVCVMLVSSCLGGLGSVLSLALMVCNCLFGNYLYMMTVQKRVMDLHRFGEPARGQYLNKYKGTSNSGIIGLVLVILTMLPFWILFGLSFIPMLY